MRAAEYAVHSENFSGIRSCSALDRDILLGHAVMVFTE